MLMVVTLMEVESASQVNLSETLGKMKISSDDGSRTVGKTLHQAGAGAAAAADSKTDTRRPQERIDDLNLLIGDVASDLKYFQLFKGQLPSSSANANAKIQQAASEPETSVSGYRLENKKIASEAALKAIKDFQGMKASAEQTSKSAPTFPDSPIGPEWSAWAAMPWATPATISPMVRMPCRGLAVSTRGST